jgi:chemotaxis signal transduction protein
VDLRRRLAADVAPDEESGASGRLLVLACAGEQLAARVDRVVDVRAVAPDEVAPAPAMVQGVAGDFVLGVLRRDGAMVFVLDVPRLFSVEERDRLRDASAALAAARESHSALA